MMAHELGPSKDLKVAGNGVLENVKSNEYIGLNGNALFVTLLLSF